MTRVVAPTNAVENPASALKVGQTFGPVTQVRVSKGRAQISYCARGTYCYPSTDLELVSPCRIAALPDSDDEQDRIYDAK